MGYVLLDSGSAGGGAGQDLVASIGSTTAVSADLKVAHTLSANTAIGIATVTVPKLDRNRGFSATITGIGTVDADLSAIRLIASPVIGAALVTGNLRVAHTLRTVGLESGVCTVSAILNTSSLDATIHGTSTVTATTIIKNAEVRPATIDGHAVVSGSLGVFHRLSATEHGAGTITSAFSVFLRGSANVIIGQASVSASLGRRINRGATSNLSILAEYRRLVGILMLVDPAFQIELSTPQTAQTFTFVKKIVKGLFYVDILTSGSVLTCQVKTGDGQNYNNVVDVSIRTISTGVVPAVVTVNTGALKASGAGACWLQTTSSGSFSVTISGATGSVLVEAFPKQGVIMSTGLDL